MAKRPVVSVALPVFNAGLYLGEALESVLGQTFSDFEIIAVDDASTDNSRDILHSYSDPRLRIIEKPQNSGMSDTLNLAISEARGDLIARMDADDVCLPQRFARQVEFLAAHPDISLCGTWAETFGDYAITIMTPTDPAYVRCDLLFRVPFLHPSVMFRKQALVDNDLRYEHLSSEDLCLFRRLSEVASLSNVPEVLFRYRVHARGLSKTDAYAKGRPDVDRLHFRRLGIEATEQNLQIHGWIADQYRQGDRLAEAEGWLNEIRAANKRTGYYPEYSLDLVMLGHWARVCLSQPVSPPKRIRLFAGSSVLRGSCLPLSVQVAETVRLIIKSVRQRRRK